MSIPGTNAEMEMKLDRHRKAFTLIELLVVVSIILVLLGLLLPAFHGVQNQARRTQARNDLAQIVTAVNAYYTEYGKYPLTPPSLADTTYGNATTNDKILNELRNVTATENPRGIVFLSPPDAKDADGPRLGISHAAATLDQYFDSWGQPYRIRVDTNYDNQVSNPYPADSTMPNIRQGVIAWSGGKDSKTPDNGGAQSARNSDDVISWQ
jgi:prepilin-type N-terminal cleavage/methylation domain-containing protein